MGISRSPSESFSILVCVWLECDMGNHRSFFFQRYATCHLYLHWWLRRECERAVHEFLVRPVAETEFGKLRSLHQSFYAPDGLFAREGAYFGFAAHDDRFFGTGVNAEAAKDATQHVNFKSRRSFFNQRIVNLFRLDVDAIGGARRRAHITSNAARRSVFARRQDVRAAITV